MFVLLARERLSSLEPMSWDRDAVSRGCLFWGWQTPTVAPVFPGTLNVDVFLSLCERRTDDVMPLFLLKILISNSSPMLMVVLG